MGGRSRLQAGLPRLYQDHRELEAVAHRRLFVLIEKELCPFSGLARLEAWRIAALGVEFNLATRVLTDARRKARTGKAASPTRGQ